MGAPAVLVVEDEPMILVELESAVEEAGFEIVGLRNGEEAIAVFDASPDRFKALLTDIRLGPGRRGKVLCRQHGIAGRVHSGRPGGGGGRPPDSMEFCNVRECAYRPSFAAG